MPLSTAGATSAAVCAACPVAFFAGNPGKRTCFNSIQHGPPYRLWGILQHSPCRVLLVHAQTSLRMLRLSALALVPQAPRPARNVALDRTTTPLVRARHLQHIPSGSDNKGQEH
jgi:hypothetical protein